MSQFKWKCLCFNCVYSNIFLFFFLVNIRTDVVYCDEGGRGAGVNNAMGV